MFHGLHTTSPRTARLPHTHSMHTSCLAILLAPLAHMGHPVTFCTPNTHTCDLMVPCKPFAHTGCLSAFLSPRGPFAHTLRRSSHGFSHSINTHGTSLHPSHVEHMHKSFPKIPTTESTICPRCIVHAAHAPPHSIPRTLSIWDNFQTKFTFFLLTFW